MSTCTVSTRCKAVEKDHVSHCPRFARLVAPVVNKTQPPQVDTRPIGTEAPLLPGETRLVARGSPDAPNAKRVTVVGVDDGRAHGDAKVVVTGHVSDGQVVIEEVKVIPAPCPAPDEVARTSFYQTPAEQAKAATKAVPFWQLPHVWYACKVGKHGQCLQEHPQDCPCKTVVGFCSCTCHDNG